MFSLSDLVRMAMIRPATPERSMHTAGPCPEWEFVLHAFFDGELDAADSFTFEQHLAQCQGCSSEVENLKSMRQKIKRSVRGWPAPVALRNRSAR